MPAASFDRCYTKALVEGELEADGVSSPWIVMADSQAGYVGCCHLKSKGQIKLATCEIMSFTQNTGHHKVSFLTDNEPRTRQILRCLLNARHALGLLSRIINSKVADHCISMHKFSLSFIAARLHMDARPTAKSTGGTRTRSRAPPHTAHVWPKRVQC